ncbi:MAG TPA: allantoate amidohydrolase [Terracidiphilus sp.]|nr:allantoate amidohydrolase [Terracidiphilus sp.]
MKERAQRAIAECQEIANLTEEPGRTTRRFLSPPTHNVHARLQRRMEALGMQVRTDAAGNLRGLWRPKGASGARLILGSHIDTVPDAGAYDGVLGVTLALELADYARESGLALPMEVIAFSEEEGVRFGVPFLGSRAVAGRFDPGLLALRDADGVTLADAIRAYGLDPAQIPDAAIAGETLGFLEIHIEQGPVLEAEGLSVAAVTGIVGQTRMSLEFAGQANHAGTTPMGLRRDALAGAAEWVGAVEAKAARAGDGLVATVGKIEAVPNADNVIAGVVRVSLDVRHPQDAQRLGAVDDLLEAANKVAARRKLALQCTHQMNQPAVSMDERMTAYMTAAIETAGLPPKQMASGAGHDAMVMAGRMPTTMLFVRSPEGISHNPAEAVREEDVESALEAGAKFVERLAGEVR